MENREEWLQKAIVKINELVFIPHKELPPRVRVSVGFPGGGSKHSRIGEYWPPEASKDGIGQIFINPKLDDTVEVLGVLTHELIHSLYPEEGHGKNFIRVAKAVGLVAPWTATTPSEELSLVLKEVKRYIGEYPHKGMVITKKVGKKSLHKFTCTHCKLTVYMTEANKAKMNNLSCCEMDLVSNED